MMHIVVFSSPQLSVAPFEFAMHFFLLCCFNGFQMQRIATLAFRYSDSNGHSFTPIYRIWLECMFFFVSCLDFVAATKANACCCYHEFMQSDMPRILLVRRCTQTNYILNWLSAWRNRKSVDVFSYSGGLRKFFY